MRERSRRSDRERHSINKLQYFQEVVAYKCPNTLHGIVYEGYIL